MKNLVTHPGTWACFAVLVVGGWLVAETQRPMFFREWVEQEDRQRMNDAQEAINEEIIERGGVPHPLPFPPRD